MKIKNREKFFKNRETGQITKKRVFPGKNCKDDQPISSQILQIYSQKF